MIAGRYSEGTLRELRATVSWDKVNGSSAPSRGARGLPSRAGGRSQTGDTMACTLRDGATKVGEVDEEFVYETRNGDTFILGSSVWRVEEIDANRLTVTPAPGQPARMPFWRGEGIGRSYELGLEVGAFRRSMEESLGKSGLPARAQARVSDRQRVCMEHPGVLPAGSWTRPASSPRQTDTSSSRSATRSATPGLSCIPRSAGG